MRPIDADLMKSRINIADVAPALDAVLKALIDNQPTIDAEPVVRCKDCKHRGTDDCPMHCKGVPDDEDFLKKVDNDFCSYGERKGEVSE